MKMNCDYAQQVVEFLTDIGLAVVEKDGASGFIDHIVIAHGELHVDPQAPASNLLHEAGHLAICSKQFRHYLSGDIDVGMARIFSELDEMQLEPDTPLLRAMLQTGDEEATAWAWAAGKAIGLPDDKIIMSHEYQGDGDTVRLALSMKAFRGINGIAHAGFCVLRPNPYKALPVYPELAFWLQR